VGQVVASAFPAEAAPAVAQIISLLALLVASWILLARVEDRPLGALGFAWTRAAPGEVARGFVIGAALIGLTTLLLLVSASVRWHAEPGSVAAHLSSLGAMLVFFAAAAAWEELAFRGYAFQVLVAAVGPVPATLAASALFAALHAQNPNVGVFALANIFLAGVMLSVAYLRTRSLWFATALHLGWNWAMASLLALPVSGLAFRPPLYAGEETGADWWTGGSFGPEAGLAGTIAIALGTLWLLRTPRLGEAPEMRALRPIVDARE
jgi:membrane protease YdiL (CAAX protease family)